MIAALCTTLFFAVTPVFANRAARLLGSTRANFWRLVVAVVLLGAWAHVAGIGLGGPAGPWFAAGGVVGFGMGGLAMFEALPRLGSNLANLIVQCGAAVTAAAVEWLWLGTRLTALQLAAAAVALTGIAIGLLPSSNRMTVGRGLRSGRAATPFAAAALSRDALAPGWNATSRRVLQSSPTGTSGSTSTWAAGLAWAFGSAVAQGVGAVMSRKAFAVAAATHHAIDPGTAAYERALGGIAVAAMALAVVRWCNLEQTASRHISAGDATQPSRKATAGRLPSSPCATPGDATPSSCAAPGDATPSSRYPAPYWVLANALTGPVLGVTCYQWALRTTPAGIVQPIVAAAPLLTIPFAAWLEHSRPRPTYYLGALLAVIGVTALMVSK